MSGSASSWSMKLNVAGSGETIVAWRVAHAS